MGDIGFHTFTKGISPKLDSVLRPEFELANYNIAVQHISHNTMATSFKISKHFIKMIMIVFLFRSQEPECKYI